MQLTVSQKIIKINTHVYDKTLSVDYLRGYGIWHSYVKVD